MSTFQLKIGTPDGLLFEGEVERVVCRGITGDLAILANHTNYLTAIGEGEAHIVLPDETVKSAACIGGMISMMNGVCHLLPTTWEWKEDIDEQRAREAKERAEKLLAQGGMDDTAYKATTAKLRRSLVRLGVKES